jgi:hypothetical protein
LKGGIRELSSNAFRVIVIPADINAPMRDETVELTEGRSHLGFLQSLVGGLVELVTSDDLVEWAARVESASDPEKGRQVGLLANEEGRLIGLPLNPRASALNRSGLVGDAVLIWERVPDWVTLPDSITVDEVAREIVRGIEALR